MAYTESTGKPGVVRHHDVNLGLAIDMVKDDGSRQLLVPSIKATQTLDFAQFWAAYEDVVRRARLNKLTADDFAGTTITLTNPGTLGNGEFGAAAHAGPRLPSSAWAPWSTPRSSKERRAETLANLAVSKVMTVTSTYDHRVIQGAQSGEFLRQIHRLLLGEDGFYDDLFRALRIPYEPVRWVQDIVSTHDDEVGKPARVIELIHAYRVRGHLMADTNPLEFEMRKHPDLDIVNHGVTLWDLDREFATGGFGGVPVMKLRDILGVLRDCLLPHDRHRVHAHLRPGAAAVDSRPLRTRAHQGHQRRAALHLEPAQRGRGVRDLPSDQVRGPEALLPRRWRDADSAARHDPRRVGTQRPR